MLSESKAQKVKNLNLFCSVSAATRFCQNIWKVRWQEKAMLGWLLAAFGMIFMILGHASHAAALDEGPGSVVPTFAPIFQGASFTVYVQNIVPGPNGDFFVAGTFTNINGVPRSRLARLKPDGSLDGQFVPKAPVVSWISGIAADTDGRVLVDGTLVDTNIDWHHVIQRTLADGSLDTGFNPGEIENGAVQSMTR